MVFGRHSIFAKYSGWRLPPIALESGESQVEYIQFSGTSRLDTGVVMTDKNFSFKCGMKSSRTGDVHYFGWYARDGIDIFQWRVGNYVGIFGIANQPDADYGGGFVSWMTANGDEYKLSKQDFLANGSWPDGSVRPIAGTRADIFCGIPSANPDSIVLNCQRLRSAGTDYNGYMNGTFYYFAAYHGGKVVRFLVPVVKSGTIGMKDMVTKQMFYPTGSASAGPSYSGNPVPRFTEPEYFT